MITQDFVFSHQWLFTDVPGGVHVGCWGLVTHQPSILKDSVSFQDPLKTPWWFQLPLNLFSDLEEIGQKPPLQQHWSLHL